jgi:hypothetical protein
MAAIDRVGQPVLQKRRRPDVHPRALATALRHFLRQGAISSLRDHVQEVLMGEFDGGWVLRAEQPVLPECPATRFEHFVDVSVQPLEQRSHACRHDHHTDICGAAELLHCVREMRPERIPYQHQWRTCVHPPFNCHGWVSSRGIVVRPRGNQGSEVVQTQNLVHPCPFLEAQRDPRRYRDISPGR